MFKYFDYFLPKNITFDDNHFLSHTKNGYEFEAYAFVVSPQEGYVIVKGADWGRIGGEMEDIILEEFDAQTKGWLVLLEEQAKQNTAIISKPTEGDLPAITYHDNHMPVWIIKIKPNQKSRLLA